MAILAIRGHETRGNEVIEILEMLGGENLYRKCGSKNDSFYYLSDEQRVCSLPISESYRDFILFTLEEFLEKFPYKVWDKVITIYGKSGVVSRPIWSERDNCVRYELEADVDSFYFVNELQPYKEQEPMEEQKLIPPYMDYDVRTYKMNPAEMDGEQFIVPIPKGYELVGVDNQQVVFEKVKPQYPKTYEECCDILQLEHIFELKDLTMDEEKLMDSFIRLKRCRDAYWKLASDWKPDWKDGNTKYIITFAQNEVYKDVSIIFNHLLVFPTEEMRDEFYKNFKSLIEKCKELL